MGKAVAASQAVSKCSESFLYVGLLLVYILYVFVHAWYLYRLEYSVLCIFKDCLYGDVFADDAYLYFCWRYNNGILCVCV